MQTHVQKSEEHGLSEAWHKETARVKCMRDQSEKERRC